MYLASTKEDLAFFFLDLNNASVVLFNLHECIHSSTLISFEFCEVSLEYRGLTPKKKKEKTATKSKFHSA